MFRTIIWATDGYELADDALPLVKELALAHDSAIIAVHVNTLLAGRLGGAPLLVEEPELKTKLREQIAQLQAEGFEASLRVVTTSGTVAQAIADVARNTEADVIVVATHAYGFAGTLLAGSVAKALVHESPCAVLAVPPGVRQPTEAVR
jgi:nucleotide-binding universal stress UspA family protein